MGKLRADGQEPHRAGAKRRQPASEAMQATPTRRDELAQHSEIAWYARRGKCGGSAVEQRVLTWGGLFREAGAGVSRGHSSRGNEPECELAQ